MDNYVAPEVQKNAFNCPHCQAYSAQHWRDLRVNMKEYFEKRSVFQIGCCELCKNVTIWYEDKMVFPQDGSTPMPNPDMPKYIQDDYLEARNIVEKSPRSACTMLRLCIQKICDEKVQGGEDLNKKISRLVKNGLDSKIQKALDSVRVIGGQAAHPLQMDLKDDVKTATALFQIVNYIADWAYTREKTIKRVFDILPDSKKDAIDFRDRNA